jgi:shikimate dehydrogenase
LDGEYNLYPVDPSEPDGLLNLTQKIRSGELAGLNVTIPHKQNIIPMVDELTSTAKLIGAVNTIYLRNGRLIGDNTDAQGFLTDLHKKAPTVMSSPGTAMVFGAGGSARAVITALLNSSWCVKIAARDIQKAQNLALYFSNQPSGKSVEAGFLDQQFMTSLMSSVNLLVNTTPIGMVPNIDQSPWPADLPWPKSLMVYDLVYNPRKTKLVNDAISLGLGAVGGLGMLVEQAALAFELWTGVEAPREVMYSAVE